MKSLTPKELAEKQKKGEKLFVLDVREDDERAAGHIPDTLHIPMGSVPLRIHEIPEDIPVVVYCKAGGRSLRVAEFLATSGRTNIINLEGGVTRWASEVAPLVRG